MVLLLHMLEKDGKWWPPSNPKKNFCLCPTRLVAVFFMFLLRFDSVLIFQRHLRQTFAIWKN